MDQDAVRQVERAAPCHGVEIEPHHEGEAEDQERLVAMAGEEFPETRDGASELIERLRVDSGHPAPRLEDVPVRRGRWRVGARAWPSASSVASELVREME